MSIEVGSIVEGVVTGITNFGAFVELPEGKVGPMPPRRGAGGDFRRQGRFGPGSASFEDKLSRFLKDSDERLTDLRRKTDSKRGGRGSRRD